MDIHSEPPMYAYHGCTMNTAYLVLPQHPCMPCYALCGDIPVRALVSTYPIFRVHGHPGAPHDSTHV